MVNLKSVVKTGRDVLPVGRASVLSSAKEVIFVRSGQARGQPLQQLEVRASRDLERASGGLPHSQRCRALATVVAATRSSRETAIEEESEDVIDLGAPRRLRRHQLQAPAAASRPASRRPLPPNPRLYPGVKPKPKTRARSAAAAEAGRPRRRKRTLRRPVPNSRLYRPVPPRPPAPPPPPARPRACWPPPAPPRALDTASRAALRVRPSPAPAPTPSPPPPPSPAAVERARHLVVTLPVEATRYRPASEHFRARAAPDASAAGSGASTPPAALVRPRAMDAADRRSASPEDRSEGNEPLSAPSEFLAEFLSAIMRRQYAEALKYCRLILQYEPHNATARGFYPLLRHRVARASRPEAAAATDGANSSSDEVSGAPPAGRGESPSGQERSRSRSRTHSSLMSQSAESAESADGSEASAAGDHSDLELDSTTDALHSSPSASRDSADRTDSGAGGGWESTGTCSASRSDADDNGNGNATVPSASAHLHPDDVENDNTSSGVGGGEPHHTARYKSESVTSLQRLRAQFACSIK